MEFRYGGQFKKDYKRILKMGKKKEKLQEAIDFIASKKDEEELSKDPTLIQKYKNHKLSGKLEGFWECHVEGDWLLMYQVENDEIIFTRTGTHSQLFG